MIVNCKGKQVILPDFLIIGAAKSGTTSLYHYLRQHSQIFLPICKEPRFFCFNEHLQYNGANLKGKNMIWRFEDYVDLFKMAKEGQIIGEATPTYLYMYKITIPRVKSIYGERYKELKIIAILRNPVDRVFSHYLFGVRRGAELLSLEEAIQQQTIENRNIETKGFDTFDYIRHGMYYEMVKAYIEEFPHVKILFFEDLNKIVKMLKDLFKFLDIDPNAKIKTDIRVNSSGIPKNRMLVDFIYKINRCFRCFKHIMPDKYFLELVSLRDNVMRKILYKPKMDQSTRKMLVNIFRKDILSLQELTKRDLSHWL